MSSKDASSMEEHSTVEEALASVKRRKLDSMVIYHHIRCLVTDLLKSSGYEAKATWRWN